MHLWRRAYMSRRMVPMASATKQKTIFLSVYDGDTERTVLRSGTFDILKQSGHRWVLLIRGADRLAYYREHFSAENVIVEPLPKGYTRVEEFWYFVGWNTLPTFAARYRRHLWQKQGSPRLRMLAGSIMWLLGHSRLWREFLRFVYLHIPDSYAAPLFDTYKPDLLFSPNMFSPEDSRLLRQAKRRGVKTIVTAKSWDVLTTKAFTRVKADRILVFNEYNRREAVELGDYAPGRVVVTGFPQFDAYTHPQLFEARDDFMRRMGLDPSKRLILFGVPGDWKTPYTNEIVAELDRRIEEGRFGPLQVLGRSHPKYPDSSEKLTLKHIRFDRPGTYFSDKKEFGVDAGTTSTFSWTFTDKDVAHLANSVKHSEVVINIDSTLTLDAAANDVPAILVGYDGDHQLPYWDSIVSAYDREHYRYVVDTGAAPLVKSHDELEAAIQLFLNDKDALRAEREALKHNLLFKVDGRATERIAAAVLEMCE